MRPHREISSAESMLEEEPLEKSVEIDNQLLLCHPSEPLRVQEKPKVELELLEDPDEWDSETDPEKETAFVFNPVGIQSLLTSFRESLLDPKISEMISSMSYPLLLPPALPTPEVPASVGVPDWVKAMASINANTTATLRVLIS
jgi:hypothetical protein